MDEGPGRLSGASLARSLQRAEVRHPFCQGGSASTWSGPVLVDGRGFGSPQECSCPVVPTYPPEFRARILDLVANGRTPEALEQELEPTAQTIRNGMKQAQLDTGQRRDGLTTDEKSELRRLRQENKRLKEEPERLETVSAWFTSRSGKLPRKPSDS